MEPIVIEFSIEIKGINPEILADAAIEGIVEAMKPVAVRGNATRIVELWEKETRRERGSITFWPKSGTQVRKKFARIPL